VIENLVNFTVGNLEIGFILLGVAVLLLGSTLTGTRSSRKD
jgi:hypothetical protein